MFIQETSCAHWEVSPSLMLLKEISEKKPESTYNTAVS